MLLNVIEAILPAGSEQWKTVASRYQIISGESTVRNHDDIRRHYMAKLCKDCKRQTGLNNKSAPTVIVARAQEIQRKILTNEATMNFGGDNENDEEGDDDDDDDSDEGDDDEDCLNGENVESTPWDENAVPSNVPLKKKIKLEYEDQKTKNSRPVNFSSSWRYFSSRQGYLQWLERGASFEPGLWVPKATAGATRSSRCSFGANADADAEPAESDDANDDDDDDPGSDEDTSLLEINK